MFPPHPYWLVCIYTITCCTCCMMVNRQGMILDAASVAALADREGWNSGAIVGAEFFIGVYTCS